MRAWSFSLGRIFGVDVRLHLLLPLMLSLCVLWTSALGRPSGRGILLWMLLLAALLVRETARAVAYAWYGIEVKSILLLPTGGVIEARSRLPEAHSPVDQRIMALAGPVANFAFGLLLAGVVLAVSPEVHLLEQRWISPLHLLRSAIWINMLLGAVNLLPAWPLDGAATQETPAKDAEGQGSRSAGRVRGLFPHSSGALSRKLLGLSIAVGLVVVGIVTTNWWILAGGMTVLLFGQAQRQGLLPGRMVPGVLVSEVMLTDFSVLSASATLEDALSHARHGLQDIYPVVRGETMVGAIGRQVALESLESKGNSYVQGAMTRRFETATPKEPLGSALARVTRSAAEDVSPLVPVLEGDRIVGILTPEHLHRSVAMLNRERARKRAIALMEER